MRKLRYRDRKISPVIVSIIGYLHDIGDWQ